MAVAHDTPTREPAPLTRRGVVKLAAMAAGGTLIESSASLCAQTKAPAPPTAAQKDKDDTRWKQTWDAAVAVLAGNVRDVPRYDRPVLFEGAVYPGIWLECGPHEGLVYGTL